MLSDNLMLSGNVFFIVILKITLYSQIVGLLLVIHKICTALMYYWSLHLYTYNYMQNNVLYNLKKIKVRKLE